MMTNKTSDYDLTVIVPVYNERGNMLRLETALVDFSEKIEGEILYFVCERRVCKMGAVI